MAELTPKQQAVYNFIAEQLQSGHPCPTRREIAAHFGFASPFAASCHIAALIRKGVLTQDTGKARSLRSSITGDSPDSTSRRPHARRNSASHRTAEIPIFGSIPAGFAQERQQESQGCVIVDLDELQLKPTPRTFALRVHGESMIGRGILDGDLVLLEHGQEPRAGEIVAALIDGQSTLKTFLIQNRKPFLKAENPKYPNLIPADELMVQGVFRALIRKAK
jgi:repressor LexA